MLGVILEAWVWKVLGCFGGVGVSGGGLFWRGGSEWWVVVLAGWDASEWWGVVL